MKTILKLAFIATCLCLMASCGDDKDSPAPKNEEEEEVDTTSPTISSVNPEDGATDVSISSNITITFSEPIDLNTVTDNTVKLNTPAFSNNIQATVTISGNLMTINPTEDLEPDSEYTLTLTIGLADAEGNNLASDFTSTFTTEYIDQEHPSVVSFSVSNGETGVSASGGITITFSEPMDSESLDGGILFRMGGTTDYLPISFDVTGNDVVVTPDEGMKGNTEYVLDVTVNVTDLAGNQLDFAKGRVFTTVEVPLTIISMTPEDDALYVEVDQEIVITFSEPINESTVSVFWAGSGPAITTSVDGAVLTVIATDGFTEFETDYLLQISSGIEDIYGNSMASSELLSFTTIFASENYYYSLRNYEMFQQLQSSSLAFQSSTPQVTYESKEALTDRSLWRFQRVGSEFGIINKFLEDNDYSAEYLYTFPINIDDDLAYTDILSTGALWTLSTPTNGVRLMKSRGNILDGQNITMTSDQSTSSGYRWWYFVRGNKIN